MIRKRIFHLMAFVLSSFISCQSPVEEISISSETAIAPESALAQLVTHSTLKDGSFDNILDNASSISVNLPVSVLANNQELRIETEADFAAIEAIFAEEPFLRDSLFIVFPATVTFSDYSQVVLENQAQLDQIVAASIEGGNDDDIECYSYNYPISLSVYDPLNQRALTREITDDQNLFEFVSQLNNDNISGFQYPLTIFDDQGEPLTINANTELESLLGTASSCDEEDEKYYIDVDDDNDIIVVPTTSLRLLLTDAPFPIDLIAEANIRLTQVELKTAEDGGEENLLVLSQVESTINLIELNNGITTTLVDIQVPTGTYDEIRLKVSESDILMKDGEVFDLKIPSGSASGIKVKLVPVLDIIEGENYDILLDFDVSQSFVVQGNPNTPAGIKGFIFKPVVKAANLSESGSISGQVTEESSTTAIEGVQLSVYAADTLNTTAFTNANGEYKILGLAAGNYEIVAEHDDYNSNSEPSALVIIREDTRVDFVLTPK